MIVPGSKLTVKIEETKYQITIKHIALDNDFRPIVTIDWYNPKARIEGSATLDYSTIKTMRILSE